MDLPILNKYSDIKQKYKNLELLSDRDRPICIVHNSPNKYFGFIGVTHTNDPENKMWTKYLEEWDKFIASANKNKLVLIEGNHRISKGKNFEEAVIDGGDAGATAWLAVRNGIKYLSPEPSFAKQIKLLKENFTEDEIITYFIGRQLHQYFRRDYKKYRDVKDYIEKTLNMYKEAYTEWLNDYNIDDVTKLVENKINKKISEADSSDFIIINDPTQNPVSEMCGIIRDTDIYLALRKAWDLKKDVFCVYGSGHAFVLEDALYKLFNEK